MTFRQTVTMMLTFEMAGWQKSGYPLVIGIQESYVVLTARVWVYLPIFAHRKAAEDDGKEHCQPCCRDQNKPRDDSLAKVMQPFLSDSLA